MNAIVERLLAYAEEVCGTLGIKAEDKQIKVWIYGLFRKLLFWVPVFLAYIGLLTAAWLWNIFGDPVALFGQKYGKGTLMLYALLLYTVASLRIVGPTELGCRLLFGKPIDNVSSGLSFIPLWIYELVTETRLVIQDELPAEPDKIYRGSDSDKEGKTVPKELQLLGMKPPIRVTFSGHNQKENENEEENGPGVVIETDDPYDKRLTAEVVPVVRWRIENFVDFLETIGSIDEARKQMEDACVKTFTETLTRVSPAVALLRIKKFSEKLQTEIEALTDSWAVKIESAQIKAINFSRTLNEAVQDVVVKERKKVADTREGEGLGARQKAILDGRTDGLKKMKDDLSVSGEAVLGAETARAIAGEGDKSGQRTIIAGSGGFADLVGTAVAIGESFKAKQGGAQ